MQYNTIKELKATHLQLYFVSHKYDIITDTRTVDLLEMFSSFYGICCW